MEFTLIFLGFSIFIVLGTIVVTLSLNPSGKKEQERPIKGTNFIPSQMFLDHDGHGGIAINEQSFRICLLKNPAVPPRLLPISDLVGSFLVKNGEILGEGRRTSPNAFISFQKVMHSNVERLIKSWETISSSHDNQRIDLIVLIHDEGAPLHIVNFLDMETKKGGILYDQAIGAATYWHNVLNSLILQADHHASLQAESDQGGAVSPEALVADELEKSGELDKKNLMAPPEFTIQKENLLAVKT